MQQTIKDNGLLHAMSGAFSMAALVLAVITHFQKDVIKYLISSNEFFGPLLIAGGLAISAPVFLFFFCLFRHEISQNAWWYRPPLPFIVILGISARIILAAIFLEPFYLQPDSGTYLNFQELNFSHRCPGYPLFIEIIARLTGNRSSAVLYPTIVIAQNIVGLAAVAMFFHTLRRLLKYDTIAVALSCVYATMPYLISWEHAILTESLAIFLIVFFVFLLTDYLLRPSHLKAFIIAGFTIPTIFTRPSFVVLLPILLVFFLLHLITLKPGKRFLKSGFAGLALFGLLLTGYVSMNARLYGRPVLTDVSHNAQMAILIFNKLYHNDAYPDVVALIRKSLITDGKTALKTAKSVASVFGYEYASQYLKDTLYLHKKPYLIYSLKKFSDLTGKELGSLAAPVSGRLQRTLINFFNSNLFFFSFGQVWGMTLLGFAIVLYFLARFKRLLWQTCITCMLITGISFTSIIGGYGAFERLAICLVPLTIILAGLLMENAVSAITGIKNRSIIRFSTGFRHFYTAACKKADIPKKTESGAFFQAD